MGQLLLKPLVHGGMTNLVVAEDLEWLKLNYPGVYYVPSKNIYQGCLWFWMSYSPSAAKGLINPNEETDFEDGFLIEDVYEIKFEFDKSNARVKVWEDGGRIMHTTVKWKLSLADVHMYKDYSLCLCPKPEEKIFFSKGFGLREFFNNLLIPFFYYQSYLERFGKEPWKSSSHGELGILESYAKQEFLHIPLRDTVATYIESLNTETVSLVVSKKKLNKSQLCLCGSKNRFQDCHPLGFAGLQKLHSDYFLTYN